MYFSLFSCRRLFQMGVHNAEIFTNMGMCCFYAQHYDMALSCFQRALAMGSDDIQAEVWYDIGHVALVSGLMILGQRLWYDMGHVALMSALEESDEMCGMT